MKNFNNYLESFIGKVKPRSQESFKWFDFEKNKELILTSLQRLDKTNEIKWLPEYDELADWCVDSKGKGLFLIGGTGRGKSNMLKLVLPVLFKFQGLEFQYVHSQYLDERKGDGEMQFRKVARRRLIAVDEVGTETKINDFGNIQDPISFLLNECEDGNKLFFATSNLDKDGVISRYGMREYSRLKRLCKIISFNSDKKDYRYE